jgi:hypothetical protein
MAKVVWGEEAEDTFFSTSLVECTFFTKKIFYSRKSCIFADE